MELILTDGNDKRFVYLCSKLDDYLNETVGGEKQKEEYNQFNTLDEIHDVILALENGEVIGCGSFKKYNEECAEVKRVFVEKSFRQRGLGKVIIKELEKHAIEKGFKKFILETGKPLIGAQKMYTSLGFKIIQNYGQYKDIDTSVCMEKVIEA